MPKLAVGNKMPDFSFVTPFEQKRTLKETLDRVQGKTALVFLRYYGCTLCQYDIHSFAKAKDDIKATGGQLLIVLQSDPVNLAEQLAPHDLPFDIVCDPEQILYQQFEVLPAPSKMKMADAGTVLKIAKATAAGHKHGSYEGNELQLPATFVIDKDQTLVYVHYGVSAGDVPSAGELVKLLGKT